MNVTNTALLPRDMEDCLESVARSVINVIDNAENYKTSAIAIGVIFAGAVLVSATTSLPFIAVWLPAAALTVLALRILSAAPGLDPRINPAHLEAIANLEDNIPEPPQTDVDDLLTLFNQINFTEKYYEGGSESPENIRPDYTDPDEIADDHGAMSRHDAKRYIERFISRIKNRESFMGVPSHTTGPFYDKVEKYVKWIIHEYKNIASGTDLVLSTQDDVDVSLLVEREKQIKRKNEFTQILLRLAVANAHCGGRVMTESIECYEISTRGAEQNALERQLQNRLHGLRRNIIHECARESHPNAGIFHAHVVLKYLLILGRERGVMGSMAIYDDVYERSVNTADAYRRFDSKYTYDLILEYVRNGINGIQSVTGGTFKEFDLADVTEWFNQNIPDDWANRTVDTENYSDAKEQFRHKFVFDTQTWKIRDEALLYLLKKTAIIS